MVLLCGKSQSTAKLSKLSGGGGGGNNNNKWTALISLGKDQVRFVQSSSPRHSLGRSLAPLFRDWPSALSLDDGRPRNQWRRVDSGKSDYFCHFIKYECFGHKSSVTPNRWYPGRTRMKSLNSDTRLPMMMILGLQLLDVFVNYMRELLYLREG